MIYNREINDSAKIQCIILYTIKQSNRPLRYDDLINLIFENCNVNFVEFQIALSHLCEIGHITKNLDSTGCDIFTINPQGIEAIKYLENTIPAYIKMPIKKYIRPYFKEESAKEKIKFDIEMIRENEYRSILGIYDDDNLPLLEIKLYAGDRSEAQKTAELFSKNPEEIYKRIVDVLVSTDDYSKERD